MTPSSDSLCRLFELTAGPFNMPPALVAALLCGDTVRREHFMTSASCALELPCRVRFHEASPRGYFYGANPRPSHMERLGFGTKPLQETANRLIAQALCERWPIPETSLLVWTKNLRVWKPFTYAKLGALNIRNLKKATATARESLGANLARQTGKDTLRGLLGRMHHAAMDSFTAFVTEKQDYENVPFYTLCACYIAQMAPVRQPPRAERKAPQTTPR